MKGIKYLLPASGDNVLKTDQQISYKVGLQMDLC